MEVDASPEMASHYGIRNVPAIILVGNGETISKKVGTAITVESVKQMLN